MELDSTEAIVSGVEAGLGVGFVSEWAIRKELRLGTLRYRTVASLDIRRAFSMIRRAGPVPGRRRRRLSKLRHEPSRRQIEIARDSALKPDKSFLSAIRFRFWILLTLGRNIGSHENDQSLRKISSSSVSSLAQPGWSRRPSRWPEGWLSPSWFSIPTPRNPAISRTSSCRHRSSCSVSA